jgi:Fasciclin domain
MIFFRFLSKTEIGDTSSIGGSNYTFFVPMDDAFEKYGFDALSDDTLKSEKIIKMILNHFVKGRLYDRDLAHGRVFETVGGKKIKITRDSAGHVSVNNAKIVESEVFVYNLGTMYYIDDILFPELLEKDIKLPTTMSDDNQKERESSEEFYTTEMAIFSENEEKSDREPTTAEYHSPLSLLLTTHSDVELIPSKFTEFFDDIDETQEIYTTPRNLPVRYVSSPKK